MKESSEQLDEREQAWERLNVDAVIIKLLEEKDSTQGKILLESEVNALCYKTRNILMTQPPLLELPVPINILGNIHGQFKDLITWFENGGYPPGSNYLFLGGYIDRGKQSLQTICLLLAYKIKYPGNFFLLRGNHESSMVNRLYGFYDDCKKYYHIRLWKTFNDLFNCLPLAAVVGKKIFCCHGGISPDLYNLDQIRKLQRPLDVPDSGIVCDLLWADPFRSISGWASNERGVSYKFGSDVIQKFLAKYDLDLICRGHQPVEDGFEFFSKRHLITIFSAPNYCGEYDNAGAMMSVDERLLCSFKILRTKVSDMSKLVTKSKV